MKMSYGKFFASTFDGSMHGAGLAVFAVWGYVIANTDMDGLIELNPQALAPKLGCSTEEVKTAVEYLCAPDPESRNPLEDGRRLIRTGTFEYEVVTYKFYHSARNDDERKEYNRKIQAKHREKMRAQKAAKTASEPVIASNNGSSPVITGNHDMSSVISNVNDSQLEISTVSHGQPPSAAVSHGQPREKESKKEKKNFTEEPKNGSSVKAADPFSQQDVNDNGNDRNDRHRIVEEVIASKRGLSLTVIDSQLPVIDKQNDTQGLSQGQVDMGITRLHPQVGGPGPVAVNGKPDGGELTATTHFFETLAIPADFATRDAATQAIRGEAIRLKLSIEEATDKILMEANAQMSNGKVINKFWFLNQEYRPAKKKSSMANTKWFDDQEKPA